jgi:hypothetical protein
LILLLSHLGMPGRFKGNLYHLSPDVYDPMQAFLPESSVAWYDETVQAVTTLAQAGQVEHLGDIPLIVLAAARSSQDLQQVWLELQQELTLLGESGEFRALEEAGHYIQYGQPQEVVKAVREVVQRCTEAAPRP